MARPSVFLEPGPKTTAGSLAIIQLSRDNLIPLILEDSTTERDGYAEGATLNTRFGSFPHSTLIGVSWGSQIRASTVDTGSRGRKRKRNEGEEEDSKGSTPNAADDFDAPTVLAPAKKAVTADSGFVHILQPTPELWTQSLPHRTQVVYTPDYSYVLSRIRAQPGTRLIEAGAGSGSFTHASVRAVYNGYPTTSCEPRGKVFSYEFNRGRYEKMHEEIASHHLTGLVELTHRDAYTGGFLVDGASPNASSVFLDLPAPWDALPHLARARPTGPEYADKFPADAGPWVSPLDPAKAAHLCTFSPCIEQVQRTISAMRRLGWIDIDMMHEEIASHHLTGLVELTHRDAYAGGFLVDGASPNASAVFLDLPAPWDALPHLSRARPTAPEYADRFPSADDDDDAAAGPWVSPLDPAKAAHLCTFSPCIEQVQRTISAMRRLGWIDIDMVEMAHRKINVLRERFPSTNPPERKAPPEPNNVGEAVARLRDIERRAREYDPHKSKAANDAIAAANAAAAAASSPMDLDAEGPAATADETAAKPWLQGRLVHRSEAELKMHTSYLVFATLPREWTDADEAAGPAANADETAAKPWLQGRLVHRSEAELKMHTSYLVFATLPREWTDADEAAVLARWPCGSETAVVGSVDKATRKREKRDMLAKKKQKRQGARPEGAEAPAADQVVPDVV
ncbi:hypothetical protein BN1723_012421 [Verticillium longisporum]|uniref:tRNA (adenine(58)-N(1))-methyltransferase catalytic subunit TRM61 n=1 Tax=Verticillium longisporum TaxID=100787 RepID=A0A0G4LHL1_VERLO|nr:hypothetical protein BN1723_012421 [Verticillium longisporum]